MKETKPVTKKSLYIELVLCIFLGGLGVHRFYAKKIGTGILYLLTYGLFGIGWLVDIILIIVRIVKFGKTTDSADVPSEAALDEVPTALPIICAPESISTEKQVTEPETLNEPATDTGTPVDAECTAVLADSPANEVSTSLPCIDPPKSVSIEAPSTAAKPEYKQKTYKVTGMQHRMENIMCLAVENSDYDMSKKELIESGLVDQRVWKYDFFPTKVELVPEPTNPSDKNAIMVVVDDEHVGYIKSGTCAHLLKVIKEDRILDISCEMGGGAYKYVAEDYDYEKDKEAYTLNRDTCPYFVHLSISEAIPQK